MIFGKIYSLAGNKNCARNQFSEVETKEFETNISP